MDEAVSTVKDQIPAVDILRVSQDGERIFLAARPRPFCGYRNRPHRPVGAGKRVAHGSLRRISVKIRFCFLLGKGKVIKSSLRIYLRHDPPVRVLGICQGSVRYTSFAIGRDRDFTVINWSGTSASMRQGQKGRYFRLNITNPTSEKTYLQAVNDGSIFENLGACIAVGGWMNPIT